MNKRPIHYEPHPVSPERKAELIGRGLRIVDAKFAPEQAVSAPQFVKAPEHDAEGFAAWENTSNNTVHLANVGSDPNADASAPVVKRKYFRKSKA